MPPPSLRHDRRGQWPDGLLNHPTDARAKAQERPAYSTCMATAERDLGGSSDRRQEGGLSAAGKAALSSLQVRPTAAVPFIVTYFMEQVKRGKNYEWEPITEASTLYWVRDGVVVDEEPLTELRFHTALACFVDAEGLPTDLTTFRLLDSRERRSRKVIARRSVRAELGELEGMKGPLMSMVSKGKLMGYVGGGTLALAGVGMLWANPFYGVAVIASGVVWAGLGGSTQEARFNSIMSGLEELRSALGRP